MEKKKLDEDKVRVIKIGREALFEFIYENFMGELEAYFDVDPLDVIGTWDINFEDGAFVFCVNKFEDASGNIMTLPDEVDLQQLMKKIPDTTSTMFANGRYREFTKTELVQLSKKTQ